MTIEYDCIHEELLQSQTKDLERLKTRADYKDKRIDELYIKMNSRGLDLTPFENFKSALIRYMKKEGGDFTKDVKHSNGVKMPYYLRFSTKMDTTWNDIFWALPTIPCDAYGVVNDVVDINNLERDARFFRFFIRYYSTIFFI